MTDRDRLYIAACKLPPSAERTEILEGLAREDRIMRTGSYGKRVVLDHYRHILGCIEHDHSQPIDGLNYRDDDISLDRWVDAAREAHAQALAAEHERVSSLHGESGTEPVVIKRARRYS